VLVVDDDMVRIWNSAKPKNAMCIWHFSHSSERDPNLELALSNEGEIVVLAGRNI